MFNFKFIFFIGINSYLEKDSIALFSAMVEDTEDNRLLFSPQFFEVKLLYACHTTVK